MSAMADGFVGSSSSSFDELVVGTAPESKKSDEQNYLKILITTHQLKADNSIFAIVLN